jgi:phosphatidylserine/phosphatidylglycerophosphate/cardiolipin synthase-like enzyme
MDPDGGGPPPVDAAPPAIDAAMTMRDSGVVATSAVTVIVEPSDNASALISAIQGAKTSIHMTMYLLSNTSVVSALISRHNAGVDVKVVLNQNFPPNAGDNTTVKGQLATAGIPVMYASTSFMYTHEKCVIIDGKTAWIMTMNATQSSARDNREYLAIDTDPNDIAEAETIFAADFAHTAVQVRGNLLVAPNNARDRLVALIATAHSTIDVEGEEFSDTAIANALVAAAGAGVHVRVVVATGTPTPAQQNAIATVKGAGIVVVAQGTPTIHAKALVVDGASAYVGSANFSGGSLGYNRELGVIVGTAAEVNKVTSAINTDYSTGVRQ